MRLLPKALPICSEEVNVSAVVELSTSFNGSTKATVESASGCVDTDVYVYGANGNGDIQYGILNTVNGADNHSKHIRGSDNHINHKSGADELIVNDGTTEYDLNSLKVKVDYLLVDFAQPSSARLASRLNGLLGLPSGTSGMTNEEYTRNCKHKTPTPFILYYLDWQ